MTHLKKIDDHHSELGLAELRTAAERSEAELNGNRVNSSLRKIDSVWFQLRRNLRTHPLVSLFVSCFVLLAFTSPATAHDLPLSYLDLQIKPEGIDATVEASAKNFARELKDTSEDALLGTSSVANYTDELLELIHSHLAITSDGQPLQLEFRAVEPLVARRDVRLRFHMVAKQPVTTLQLNCDLFSFDARHRTFLNIYQGEKLRYQGIFDNETNHLYVTLTSHQPIFAVIQQFVWQGVHHIFIGPDHILFIIGLLLLGGTVWQLLRIVTAFTIAHTVTLVLATLNVLNPPARVIEPAIALSIVFVGVHALLQEKGWRDWRLLFAFCFGFVHGFGFANVLREMDLPRAALGWSLFSFNVGVEIGQACIVLAVAPALALLYRRTARLTGRLVTAGSFCVVAAGSFWFFQRVFA